jgi:hypothetical protein
MPRTTGPTTGQTLAEISRRRDDRGIASPDGMATYLETVLAEAGAALLACAREPALGPGLRDRIEALADAVADLRRHLRWTGPAPAGLDGHGDPLPAMTRVMLGEVERAALCGAFRERCGELAYRLPDPERTRAGVDELWTGLKLVRRALGVRPED